MDFYSLKLPSTYLNRNAPPFIPRTTWVLFYKKETRETMWNAVFWGGVSGSAVLLGALAAIFIPINKNIIGLGIWNEYIDW